MTSPALKIVPKAPPQAAAAAAVVTLPRRRTAFAERLSGAARLGAARILPPLLVLAVFGLVWEIACSHPAPACRRPPRCSPTATS